MGGSASSTRSRIFLLRLTRLSCPGFRLISGDFLVELTASSICCMTRLSPCHTSTIPALRLTLTQRNVTAPYSFFQLNSYSISRSIVSPDLTPFAVVVPFALSKVALHSKTILLMLPVTYHGVSTVFNLIMLHLH